MSEQTEWRKCVFLDAGQELLGEPFDEDKPVAGCRLGVCDELGLTRKACASCPIPALQAKADLCGEMAEALRLNIVGWDAVRGIEGLARAHGVQVQPVRDAQGHTIKELNEPALAKYDALEKLEANDEPTETA